MPARFLTRKQVAGELNISMAQAYALIRRGELLAAKIGAGGEYRIGRDDLEAYIGRTLRRDQPVARALSEATVTGIVFLLTHAAETGCRRITPAGV